jgi:hypothetical protein
MADWRFCERFLDRRIVRYVILGTRDRGHYLGCNLSVTNFQGTWWGEGDDMIWVDGCKWPPDLHGTGSEDYLNQAWVMQGNAFLRNGSAIRQDHAGGYQTSYVLHGENPVRFEKEIRVAIESVGMRTASPTKCHRSRAGTADRPCAACGISAAIRDRAVEQTRRHPDTCRGWTHVHARLPRTACKEHGVRQVEARAGRRRRGGRPRARLARATGSM